MFLMRGSTANSLLKQGSTKKQMNHKKLYLAEKVIASLLFSSVLLTSCGTPHKGIEISTPSELFSSTAVEEKGPEALNLFNLTNADLIKSQSQSNYDKNHPIRTLKLPEPHIAKKEIATLKADQDLTITFPPVDNRPYYLRLYGLNEKDIVQLEMKTGTDLAFPITHTLTAQLPSYVFQAGKQTSPMEITMKSRSTLHNLRLEVVYQELNTELTGYDIIEDSISGFYFGNSYTYTVPVTGLYIFRLECKRPNTTLQFRLTDNDGERNWVDLGGGSRALLPIDKKPTHYTFRGAPNEFFLVSLKEGHHCQINIQFGQPEQEFEGIYPFKLTIER